MAHQGVISGHPAISRGPGLEDLPEVGYRHVTLAGVQVTPRDAVLQEQCDVLCDQWRRQPLPDLPVSRYRSFFGTVGLDPAKTPVPFADLIRRHLAKGTFPSVNNVVDAGNAACARFLVAMAVFDLDQISGELTLRYSEPDEEFQQIGRDRPSRLPGGRLVLSDEKRVVSIFAYRDSAHTRITATTTNVLLAACRVPGIAETSLEEGLAYATALITRS
jgi:DNA/RNA-binding domain of Phe-tRNA-synthetase-like protein